jgi:hypothetical protein
MFGRPCWVCERADEGSTVYNMHKSAIVDIIHVCYSANKLADDKEVVSR